MAAVTVRFGKLALALALALAGCARHPVPFVALSGTLTLPVPESLALDGASISIVSLSGTLARLGATTARQTLAATPAQPAKGSYALEVDASSLPAAPTFFLVQLDNPEPAPWNGPILEAAVALSRPPGAGPDLGGVEVDLDATSSAAAMALQYRQGLSVALDPARIAPVALASYLGGKTSVAFDFAAAFVRYTTGQTRTAPCDSAAIAREASQALPTDLATVSR